MRKPPERLVAGLKCGEVLAALSDFVDGEIPSTMREKILAHLRGCKWCEKFGGRFSRIIDTLRRELARPEPLDHGVAARLRARLSKE